MEKEALHIAALIRKGSPEGFRKAAEEFGPRIYALALEITGSHPEAEEATSDALLRAFRSIDSFHPDKGSFTGWIMRIARNSAISALRKRSPETSVADLPEQIPTPDSDESEETELVKEAIDRCSTDERELIQLYYFDDLSLKEIADITGVQAPTLAVRLQRIRQKIKTYIQDHGR